MTNTPISSGRGGARETLASEPRNLLLLFLLFLLSLPLINPWVRGDGVGYYAYLRAPWIQHNFDFTADYRAANSSFRDDRLDAEGHVKPEFLTPTRHLENHFTVGPAILWTPFFLTAHGVVRTARSFGSAIPADGFSSPYRIAVSLGTAIYGFLGLLFSYFLARKYISNPWALLATLAIWGASSLPVYMYFNPSWSHAHSACMVAIYLWYWDRTRGHRTRTQWIILGIIVGLMLNVYYANLMLVAVLGVEALMQYRELAGLGQVGFSRLRQLIGYQLVFGLTVLICLLPTFISRTIIYGGPFRTGYIPMGDWNWTSPVLRSVLFSANHGLLSWTPLIAIAILGIFLFAFRMPRVGFPFLAATIAFYLFISVYPDWAGISSFGNRFFISLTPLFILGLAYVLERFASLFAKPLLPALLSSAVLLAFLLWNAGMIFQWGAHLIPVRGPISFQQAAYNQFHIVPQQLAGHVRAYIFRRSALMEQIEKKDVEQLKQQSPQP